MVNSGERRAEGFETGIGYWRCGFGGYWGGDAPLSGDEKGWVACVQMQHPVWCESELHMMNIQ